MAALFERRRALGLAPLTIDTSSYQQISISKEEVKKSIRSLEDQVAPQFFRSLEGDPSATVLSLLQKKYPGQSISLVKVGSNSTDDTFFVKVDGVSRHVLKRASIPKGVFESSWNNTENHIRHASGHSLQEKVQDVFFTSPAQLLTHDFPHISYAHREKLASLIGAELGVPHTTLFRAQEGYYSLHDYVENVGTWTEVDLDSKEKAFKVDTQSLQNIGILDILIESQDRNTGNVLVVPNKESYLLIPVDHALTLQKKDFHVFTSWSGEYQRPCWTRLEKAHEPLTEATKNHIRQLASENGPLTRIEMSELHVEDEKIKLHRNAAFMAKMIDMYPNITLMELHKASLNRR